MMIWLGDKGSKMSNSAYTDYLQSEINERYKEEGRHPPLFVPAGSPTKVLEDVTLLSSCASDWYPIKSVQGTTISVDEFKRDYLGNRKENNTMTRPLTKEEAKLRRQEAEVKNALTQANFVIIRVSEILDQGGDSFNLEDDLMESSVAALQEVFPFVSLEQESKSEKYAPRAA